MKREFKLYLVDIQEAIRRVKLYTKELSFEEFSENTQTIDAVMRNLEIIGEAVSQLPEDVKDKYPEVPWRDIKNFRNIAAHKYFKINLEIIWNIIKNKIDSLEKQIIQIIQYKEMR